MATPTALPFVSPARRRPNAPKTEGNGVDWNRLILASGRFQALKQGFRLLAEPGTRAGLKGSFIKNYARSVSNLHGWADGDEFYVNYLGHPMQGSVAGFLWTQNDRDYRRVEFGRDPLYWKSRLRAAAFAWAYSTQFEIGLSSEASIGAVQKTYPQQGFVDHVITPSLGFAWIAAEDAIDEYVIERIENATENRWLRLAARTGMNPARSFSNLMLGIAPWNRSTRAGVASYRPARRAPVERAPAPAAAAMADGPGPPPFEFNATFQPERLWGDGNRVLCYGGGGTAAFRVAPSWQVVMDVGGCKMTGLGKNVSGDSLTYMAGLRWVRGGRGLWTAHWQFLAGGNKITQERNWPEREKLLMEAALRNGSSAPAHDAYTDAIETNGVAVAAGGGLDYRFNRALAIRVGELSYRRSWVEPLWGRTYNHSLKFVSGLVLRMGTW